MCYYCWCTYDCNTQPRSGGDGMRRIAEKMGYVTDVVGDDTYIFDPSGNRFLFDPSNDCGLRERIIESFGINVFCIHGGAWRVSLLSKAAGKKAQKAVIVDADDRVLAFIKALYEIAEDIEHFEVIT